MVDVAGKRRRDVSVVAVSVHVTVDCLPSEKITLQSETDAFP